MAMVEGVTLVTQFDTDNRQYNVYPIENPIMLTFEGGKDDLVDCSIGQCRAKLQFQLFQAGITNNKYVNNAYIEIQTAFGINRIFFKDNPTKFDIPSIAVTTNLQVMWERLYFILNSIAGITNYYDVIPYSFTNDFILQAKNNGSKYNINFTYSPTFVYATDILYTATNGSDKYEALLYDDYGCFVEVWVDKAAKHKDYFSVSGLADAIWSKIDTLEKSWQASNFMQVDISKSIKPYVESHSPLYEPSFSTNTQFVKATKMFNRFAIIVGYFTRQGVNKSYHYVARYGFQDFSDTNHLELIAVNSAMSTFLTPAQAKFDYRNFWVRSSPSYACQALTRQPNVKATNINAIEFLYFAYYRTGVAYNKLELWCSYEFTDGTSVASTLIYSKPVVVTPPNYAGEYGSFYYTETSPRAVDILGVQTANAGKLVKTYSVSIYEAVGTSKQLITQRSYKIDTEFNCKEFYTDVIFLNSLGGFDSLFCFGYTTKSINSNTTEYDSTLQWIDKDGVPTNTNSALDTKQLSITNVYKNLAYAEYELESGWLDRQHIEWLEDLTLSTEVYIVKPDDYSIEASVEQPYVNNLRKVVILSNSYEKNDLEDTYRIKLKVRSTLPLNDITQ